MSLAPLGIRKIAALVYYVHDLARVRAFLLDEYVGVPREHAQRFRSVIDRDLVAYDEVYAAAGTPHAVFPITPADLQRVTGGVVVDLAVQSSRP